MTKIVIGLDPTAKGYNGYLADPDTKPYRTFAFAVLEWEVPGVGVHRFTIISQAWLDENDEPTVVLNYIDPCEGSECPGSYFSDGKEVDYQMGPVFFTEDYYPEGTFGFRGETLSKIMEKFDLTRTKDLIYKWEKDQRIPGELNDKLMFGWFWTKK